MSFIVKIAAAATAGLLSITPALATDESTFGSAYGSGFADGLVERGNGGVITDGNSVAISRADTNPAYGTGFGSDQRVIGVAAESRNGSQGDFFMESAAGAEARRGAGVETADASSGGEGAFNADASGRERQTAGLTVGTSRASGFALERPGNQNDRAEAEADQTTISAAESRAADRKAAAAASSAVAESRAQATDSQ